MKKSVRDLVINPINPRRIVVGNKRRLQQSIMLFPKMLYYRDIIVNKDNVVLAGNQRTTLLKEILSTTPMDWMVILQENEKWIGMTEKQREGVIEYWKSWIDNPEVEVTVSELNDDEEKELIIKDNNEFGEFDYNALKLIYDEVNLVNFGFDEGLFYNPEEDETVTTKIKGSKPKKINMLTFGKNVVAVTKEEYEALVERYNNYVDDAGVSFGFVASLLQGKIDIEPEMIPMDSTEEIILPQ